MQQSAVGGRPSVKPRSHCAQYCAALRCSSCAVLRSTAQYGTVLRSMARHCAVLRCVAHICLYLHCKSSDVNTDMPDDDVFAIAKTSSSLVFSVQ